MSNKDIKRITFYFFTLLIPLVILGGSEFALRHLPEYENNLLFVSVPESNHDVINSRYFNRYFNSFKPSVSISPIQSDRTSSTFRILALGGSTMAGYPYSHHYSIPSIIELNLKKTFPQIQFEVINVAVTAFNSFGIADIADKLSQVEPDAIIIYAGHNEFYGSLGSASTEGMFESALLRRLYLNVYPLALFQFGKRLLDSTSNAIIEDRSRATTMSRMIRNASISIDSDLYKNTVSDFEVNLTELVSKSNALGIPIVISTVVSNLKDQTPLDGSRLANELFMHGHDLLSKNLIDSARVVFSRARDYDTVRFRASRDINNVILDTHRLNNVHVIDIEQTYRDMCTSGIEDDTCFTDHLHPNLQGYGYLAATFFDVLTPIVLDNMALAPTGPIKFITPNLDPIEELLSDINIKILKSAPPFKSNTSEKGETLDSILIHLNNQTDPISQAAIQILTNHAHPSTVYNRLSSSPDINTNSFFYYSWSQWDPFNENSIHSGVQRLLNKQHIEHTLEAVLLRASNRFNTTYFYNLLGALYLQQKEYDAAKSFLNVVERRTPDDASMLFNMAVLHYETEDFETALLYQDKYQHASINMDSNSRPNSANQ
jgi:lysophospholipase L1-like esterase